MKTIVYKLVYAEGPSEYHAVMARGINTGFPKVLSLRDPRRELARVEFWEVKSC